MDENLYKEEEYDELSHNKLTIPPKESENKEKEQEFEKESIELFISYLDCLKSFDDAGDYINETKIYEDIIQLFHENRPFPYEYYQNNKFILYLSNYIKSLKELEDSSVFLLPISISNIIVRKSLRLAEIFLHSDILLTFNTLIYEDNLFIDLVHLYGYLLSKTKEMKKSVINFNDYSKLFDMIENYLVDNNIFDSDKDLTTSFVVFYTNIISKIKEDEQGIGMSNSIGDFFMFLFIPDVKEEVLIHVIEGIIVGFTKFPNLIGLMCQYEFVPKFMAILQQYSSESSDESERVMIFMSKLILKISLMPPYTLGLLDEYMNETEEFYNVFFFCCLHKNEEVAKNFIEAASNLISSEIILPEILINSDFNSILLTAITEGIFFIKQAAIMCILAISKVSEPNQLSEIITPNILSSLATNIDSLSKGDEQYFINCLDIVLQKFSSLGYLNDVIEALHSDELCEFLQELDNETDDKEFVDQLHSVSKVLRFYNDDEA